MLVEKSKCTVTRMVRLLGVSRSGFYAWLVRVPSKRAIRAERIEAKVAWFHGDSDEVSGSPKILADLRGDGEVMHTLSLHPPNRRGINRDRYTSRPSAMGRHSRGGLAEMNNSSRNLNGASHEHSDHCPGRRPAGAWAGGADRQAVRAGRFVPAGSGGGLAPTWVCLLYTSPSPRDRQKSR